METIKFKGKDYPIRTFTMTSKETGEVTCTIATDSLSEAMGDEKEKFNMEANDIDNTIYFYVEDEVINLSAEEICKNCLDIEFEFITEEF